MQAWNALLSLWPSHCVLCHTAVNHHRQTLCPNCWRALPRPRHQCRQCAAELPQMVSGSSICGRCLTHPHSRLKTVAPLLYEAGARELIHLFKYRDRPGLSRSLGNMLAQAVLRTCPQLLPQLLIPVPLHPRRLGARGYNQAALLAQRLGEVLRIPVHSGYLERRVYTPPLANMGYHDRVRILHKVFDCRGNVMRDQSVALVDDIITTGATAKAAVHALREGGVTCTALWVLARTGRNRP